ncbi:TonB-dependent receptor [Gemmatimonas sp.]|uniref:TonB-dependent receptor n=1 Tax=Gemmatimonas sp. TaxID=1962908 RepID=UPI00334097F1
MPASFDSRRPGRLAGAAASLVAGLLLPASAFAARLSTVEPACTKSVPSADRASLWAPPLDRVVTLRVTDVSVRDAVDRLASVAHLELSYSADLLPADRRVCLALDRVPVGAVLDLLLEGSALRPIVLGSTQVVLAPSRITATRAGSEVPISRRSSVLDRVVVTGSPDGAAQRGSPYALNVVDGAQLAEHGVGTLGEALDLSVPGVWTWTAAAGSLTARYGSIRGASSFGVSAPKIYLDGIEVANPLLVTQLDPSRVARVEVIRGPQGAALYGADAISGVVNILTRHDGAPQGRQQTQLSTSAGISATAYAARDPFVQEHSLSYRRGSASRNLGLGVNVGTVGAYVPGASERRLLLDADARFSRQQTIFTGMARLSLMRANASTSLLLSTDGVSTFSAQPSALMVTVNDGAFRRAVSVGAIDTMRGGALRDSLRGAVRVDSANGQQVAQYTVGGSVAFMPNLRWTHTLIGGVDGYRLQGLSAFALAGPQSLSNAAQAGSGEGAADRASLRWRSVGRYDIAPATLLTTTFAVEQAFTHEVVGGAGVIATAGVGSGPNGPGGNGALLGGPVARVRESSTSYGTTGVSAQAQVAWQDRWFASAGVRAERIGGATLNTQQSLLPMLGAAYVRDVGDVVVKVRGAFGTGIRPARALTRSSSWLGPGQYASLSSLEPERQTGTEAGVDLLLGARTALHVTRFDQRASGLIQPVSALVTTVSGSGRLSRSMTYTLQNVGAIDNHGWELEATTRVQRLSLAAAVALVDSRVAQLASGYRGDMRVGDRMLDVPSNTVSLTAAYTSGRWSVAGTAIRAADWIGYDRAGIGTALADSALSPREFEGANLRRYWMTYAGITRVRASTSFRVRGDLSVLVGGDNLLNVQTGAPDNASVISGRTLTLGLRTSF